MSQVTCQGAFDWYIAANRDRDDEFHRRTLGAWCHVSKVFGPVVVVSAAWGALTRKYVATRTSATASGVAREIGVLRACLNFAAKEGRITAAPKLVLPATSLVIRDRFLSEDEITRLLQAKMSPHLKLFIHLALKTAGRKSAILGLTWDRVDLENRLIDLRDPDISGKRKGRAVVPIGENLHDLLVKSRDSATSRTVVAYAGLKVRDVGQGLKAAGRRAGILGVTPHVLRHTAATHMVRSGVSIWEVAKFLGHSSVTTTERVYAHHKPEYLRDAAQAMDKFR